MWISAFHWRMSIKDLDKILQEKYNFKTDIIFTNDVNPKRSHELRVFVTKEDIYDLREEFDVMLLDRNGKDYMYLDTKGFRFTQR